MNILFFLTPKHDVDFIYEDYTLRQAVEKMEYHGYTAVPVLTRDGNYAGTLSEGDILRYVKESHRLDLKSAESIPVSQIPQGRHYTCVSATSLMENLIDVACCQNFVPVVDDDNVFIGIITRKDIIRHSYHEILRLKFQLRDCGDKE